MTSKIVPGIMRPWIKEAAVYQQARLTFHRLPFKLRSVVQLQITYKEMAMRLKADF